MESGVANRLHFGREPVKARGRYQVLTAMRSLLLRRFYISVVTGHLISVGGLRGFFGNCQRLSALHGTYESVSPQPTPQDCTTSKRSC